MPSRLTPLVASLLLAIVGPAQSQSPQSLAAAVPVSTLANDSAEGGVSFCPLDSYLLIGRAGFALGFAIGWVV
jgi:hypothetical protein